VLGTRDLAFFRFSLVIGRVLVTKRPVQRQAQRHLMAQAASRSFLHEALGGIATLKAAGAEDHVLDRGRICSPRSSMSAADGRRCRLW
jgi:ABC-type bacteriocin/lantibiotic exporter with double-glycine peptidase domain